MPDALVVPPASTKSAPQRSGDHAPTVGDDGSTRASTKSAPQRSGDKRLDGGAHHGFGASTKSAPQRSGDSHSAVSTPTGGSGPQRSPLPKGAETSRIGGARAALTRLNEVRSPKERRRVWGAVRGPGAAASTKSAPQRSGDSTSDYSPLTWADATFGEPWAQEASVERHAYRPRPMNRGLTSPFLMRRLAGFRTSTEPSRRSLGRFR